MKEQEPKSLNPRTIGHPAKTVEELLTVEIANIEAAIKQAGPDLYQEGKLFAFQRISDHIEFVLKRERVSGETPKPDPENDYPMDEEAWGDVRLIIGINSPDDAAMLIRQMIEPKLKKLSSGAKTPDFSYFKIQVLEQDLKLAHESIQRWSDDYTELQREIEELAGGSVPTPDLETLKSEIEVELSALPKRESEYESGQGLAYNKVLNMLEKFELRTVPTLSDEDVSKAALTYQEMIGGNRSDACSFTEGVTWAKEWLRGRLSPELGKDADKG